MTPRLLLLAALAALFAGAAPSAAAARAERCRPPVAASLRVTSPQPYAGDRPLLATVTPNADGLRDGIALSFRLSAPAAVRVLIRREAPPRAVVAVLAAALGRGPQVLRWDPPSDLAPGALRVLVSLAPAGCPSARRVAVAERGREVVPVVEVRGIEAAFARESYRPGEIADVRIAADARVLTVDVLRLGQGPHPRVQELRGTPVATARELDWSGRRSAPSTVRLAVGADWVSGLYALRLTADDGRVGYAPFVVRPAHLGMRRVAVVLPTRTWQAYNFYDADGDGYGDTWYAGPQTKTVLLGRPYLDRGVPPHARLYDLPFLYWLHTRKREVDVLAQSDLESGTTGAALAAAYDLMIFPGHHEYVTSREYDVITRYRDLGGNLAFFSANNFFYRAERHFSILGPRRAWRTLGRPEAALVGTQYRASDRGQSKGAFVVGNDPAGAWLFEGTGLLPGDAFGSFGIEIDSRAPSSPPGTVLMAQIPDLMGAGVSAHMTYYETPADARVFAAGAFGFVSAPLARPVAQLLENLWARLAEPAPGVTRHRPPGTPRGAARFSRR